MDITPKPSSRSELQSSSPLKLGQSAISSVEDLKLEQDKIYKAKVLQELANKDASLKELKPSNDQNQANNPRDWILRLNGKLARVSGNLSLAVGQTILVKLESSASNQAKALTIVGENKQNIPAPTGNLSSESSHTLKALSKLLSKQLSLATGFAALNQHHSKHQLPQSASTLVKSNESPTKPNTQTLHSNSPTVQSSSSSSPSTERQLVRNIIGNLINSLPKAESLAQSRKLSPQQPPSNIIQHAIRNSGTFLESSLNNQATKDQLITQLKNLLKQANQPASPSQPSEQKAQLSPTQQADSSLNRNAPKNTTHTTIKPTPREQALNLLQDLIKQHDSGATKTVDATKSTPEDLKATLLGLSRVILADKNIAAQPSPLIDELLGSVLEPDLLTTPFNFPRIQSETISKAQALFADQELSTGQLLKIFAGMLNRIQFNQLNSLFQSQNTDGNTLQSWFFELPLVNTNQEINSFEIRIDKEKNPSGNLDEENEDQALQWKLTLSFDLEELGAMYIQVSLLPPTVSSIIWADKEDTFRLAQTEMSHLKSKLTSIGLEVGDIICQKGLPPQQTTKLTQSLVDVQA